MLNRLQGLPLNAPWGGHTLQFKEVRLSKTHNRMGARTSWKISWGGGGRGAFSIRSRHAEWSRTHPQLTDEGSSQPEVVVNQVPAM